MIKTLGQIVTISKGKKHSIAETISDKSIRYIQIEDLRNDLNLKYTDDLKGVNVTQKDVLIAWDGANAGTIGYNLSGKIGSTLARLRLKENVKIDSIFLGKFLESKFEYLRKTATGATIPHINRKALEKIEIPIFDLIDQKRIAKLLCDCEDLIAKRKESIILLDELVKSTFLEMFGDPLLDSRWELLKLQKLTTKIGSGSTPRGGKNAYKEDGISLIRSLNIYDNRFKTKNLAFIDENQAYKLKNVTVKKNDVLINITGASVARVTVVPEEVLPARVNQHVAILRVDQKIIDSQYLAYLLNSQNFKKNLIKIATLGGATREALNKSQLENLIIPVPPIGLQNKFHSVVTEAIKLQKLYKKSLTEIKNLSNVLNLLAFKGGLAFSDFTPITSNYTTNDNDSKIADTKDKSFISIEHRVIDNNFMIPEPKVSKQERVVLEKFEDLSIERVSDLIKERFGRNHFSFEELINFFENEKQLQTPYFTSQDLNSNPYLNNRDDLKKFIFSSLETSSEKATNPFLKLKQFFYNALDENFDLKLKEKDFKKFKSLTQFQKSGLYFKIMQ
ncbi:restriction endonuclease subunit S [Salinimicrobium sp. TIG7-5_MAKvit]|uniref:restriction endonuclease subunit S n=1 Tax=Salinimicrobium sp. TIG7-5_MAKvit TaxID=3121289 RepID=UPI003C6E3632